LGNVSKLMEPPSHLASLGTNHTTLQIHPMVPALFLFKFWNSEAKYVNTYPLWEVSPNVTAFFKGPVED